MNAPIPISQVPQAPSMARSFRQYLTDPRLKPTVMEALGWKCYCKLHHGVPILRAEDDEFREAYDGAIKGLTYEQKLLVMRVFPVTSRMTTKQLTKYAEAVRDDFASRGVHLDFPQGGQ